MKYMLLIYGAENCWTEAERRECMLESMGICDELAREGKWIASSPLYSVNTATSIRVRDGKRLITDGPFAETTEQLGGYYIIEVEHLDEAIEIASRLPPAKKGTVEIRPLFPLPELPQSEKACEHYRGKLRIAAAPEVVYRALAKQAGLQAWWTTTCTVGTKPGDYSTFRFGDTHKTMRIESLVPDEEVCWQCVASRLVVPDRLTRTDEWVGTSLLFRLQSPAPNETLLSFEHFGLGPHCECYQICSDGWNHYLDSLRQYCETGSGAPYCTPEE